MQLKFSDTYTSLNLKPECNLPTKCSTTRVNIINHCLIRFYKQPLNMFEVLRTEKFWHQSVYLIWNATESLVMMIHKMRDLFDWWFILFNFIMKHDFSSIDCLPINMMVYIIIEQFCLHVKYWHDFSHLIKYLRICQANKSL